MISDDINKICIWCRYQEPEVTFKRLAHIFPQSLGGTRVCKNVCDDCNSYFGSKQTGLPSVEIALKEPLNISKRYLLSQVERNVKLPKFKSEYFDYDLVKHIIRPKFKYRFISEFQFMFTKQFKRGIYKIFLEERSESKGDALDPQFGFIREFARYGLGDYPVFYCKPVHPVIYTSTEDIKNPVIRFTEHSDNIMKQYGFYDYMFMSHEIAFPVICAWELNFDNYTRYMLAGERPLCSKLIPIRYMDDLDFIFAYVNTIG